MIYVVNKHKHKKTAKDIYIGRGSELGNPFTHKELENTKAQYKCDSREKAILNYEFYIRDKIEKRDSNICKKLNEIFSMACKNDVFLVCFCKPKSCHGDIIKKIIEEKLNRLDDLF